MSGSRAKLFGCLGAGDLRQGCGSLGGDGELAEGFIMGSNVFCSCWDGKLLITDQSNRAPERHSEAADGFLLSDSELAVPWLIFPEDEKGILHLFAAVLL